MRDESRLYEYILGLLSQEESQALERELAASAELRTELKALQNTIGTLATAAEPMTPSAGLRSRLLASLDDESRFDGFVARLQTFLDFSTQQVHALLEVVKTAPGSPWRESGMPGIWLYPFQGGENITDTAGQLLYMAPGSIFPPHRHRGSEWGFVLQGHIIEDSGHHYGAGDIVHKATGTQHSFHVQDEEAAIIFTLLEDKIEWLRQ